MTGAPLPPLPYAGPPGAARVDPGPPLPSLPARLRPPQVILGVGVVLLVATALAGPSLAGGVARIGVLLLALVAACAAAWAARARLRSTEEACAAAAVALALTGAAGGERTADGGPLPALGLAVLLLSLRVLLPRPLSWPLGAWLALQVAALRSLALVPAGLPRTALLLGVALAGLAVTLTARRPLARVALVTTAPWFVAGAAGGLVGAATGAGDARRVAAGLPVAAAAALLLVRLERAVEPLLGPPRLVPGVAGLVAGGAVGAALSTDGPVPLPLAGWLGVLLASVAAATLTGWRRGLLLPAATAAGLVLVVPAVAQLVAAARWPSLIALLVLLALSAAGVAAARRDERARALAEAVGCLVAAALLAVPAGLLSAGAAAAALTGLFAGTLAARPALAADVRGATGTVGAVCAGAALVVLAVSAAWGPLAAQLAVQGVLVCAWAAPAARGGEAEAAWRTGALELGAAGWTLAALTGTAVVEAWSLPAAAALLVAAGPRLFDGPSWPVWGPGLVAAAAPSTVAAVVQPGALRPLPVLVAAAAAMALGARAAVRAPLFVGAATAVALGVGLAVEALPLPLAGVLVAGAGLLALGARRELRPVAGFGARLSEMR
ncbi:SCO7613 C-terminal domain-containing membrane protein [Geodermatophilus arenarius]|uniref:SCO7613 C-terminal domain-containing membrane protein n=1 Tax=Geodermatophilus arenarius TaxID=1137990 RepID=A0ABV9LPD0_9ACTN